MNVGDLIKQRQTICGLSQRELAEKSGISENYISMIEREVQKAETTTTLEHLAVALGTTLELSLNDQVVEDNYDF